MNRIVLIGNGFDLAHGLKTSYKDFIEYLWRRIRDQLYEQIKLSYSNYQFTNICFEDSTELLTVNINRIAQMTGNNAYLLNSSLELSQVSISKNDILRFIDEMKLFNHVYKNSFFGKISTSYLEKNWSDIEADYYRELNRCKGSKDLVCELNKDFLQIKELLAEYLKSLDKKASIMGIDNIIHSPIIIKHIRLNRLEIMCDYLNRKIPTLEKASKKKISEYLIKKGIIGSKYSVASENGTVDLFEAGKITINHILKKSLFSEMDWKIISPESIVFLNFNYTDTIEQYKSKEILNKLSNEAISIETNQIHGTLKSSNEMIFGYGDEEDEKYKELEMLETPGLLDNVKSINYLQSSEYRDLERFIESGAYQILILGMSCGMADRTLLRKLFQHKNCISILPYYYEYIDKEGKSRDNFSELIQNISRCFSDKDLLRSIVVHKKECDPLPQCPKEN